METMSSALKSLRALSDPTRLRMVALLEREELSVNELQEVTWLGQSRISTHLGLLQDAGLLQSRREGKRTFYKSSPPADGAARELIQLAIRGAKIPALAWRKGPRAAHAAFVDRWAKRIHLLSPDDAATGRARR